jgi:hypothetical protein
MVIVDTSVWIDFFKDRSTPEVHLLEKTLEEEEDIFTTGLILQEVLSGIKKKREREAVKSNFRQFILIMPTWETHIQAAEIFDACQKKGFTVRSTIDCLIAALAIEYDLPLLQRDRDYDFIARATKLKLFKPQ